MTMEDIGARPNPQPVGYQRRDILTGTQQVIIDRDSVENLNLTLSRLLRDIRKLINHSIPAAQLLATSTESTVDNTKPVEIFFKGEGENKKATKLLIFGGADFYFDFDRPATINSMFYDASVQGNQPLIFENIEVERISVLGTSATALTINSFTTGADPVATNYIGIRAFAPVSYRDDVAY